MIKWKIKFFILIFIYKSKFINSENYSGNENEVNIYDQDQYFSYIIEPEITQIKYINYSEYHEFSFRGIDKLKQKDLLVNFYSIDCNIEINNVVEDYEKYIFITGIKRNIHSILIKKNKNKKNIELLIIPSNISGNKDKFNDSRICPVLINSYYLGESKIIIENNEYMALNFIENITTIELTYQIKNLTEDHFIVLSFISNENLNFNIDIKNILNRVISNSSNIFLYYEELSKIENGILTIKINHSKENILEKENNSVLIFKLIESNSISILEKNKLNLGFTFSKKVSQYYYLEVVKEEEGEIMLHNKRLYGELYGFIKPKSKINPYNRAEYVKEDKNNQLPFDANTRKLSFKSYQTKQCEEDGCYLLIRYSQDNFNFNPRVGFEYTLLVRIWEKEEMDPEIIDIPFNEYIFGVFEDNSIYNHYYSLFLPNNTKAIIIQFNGNYIEGFIGPKKKKLNTIRNPINTKKINDGKNQIIKEYYFNDSNINNYNINDYITFAFRPKNFFNDDFSFYYFRILLLKKSEINIIYPLDSNLGNFCIPKKEGNDYFCYCLLKNYYNEFSLNYSISTSYQKGKLTYNYFEIINGEIKGYNFTNISSASIEKYSNYTSLIKFKFENEKYSDILSTLANKKQKIYPQIYSTQMYYFRENKEFIFNLNYSFTLIVNHILGQGKIKNYNDTLNMNVNFKGKPFFFPINTGKRNFSFLQTQELIFYIEFQQYNEIKELTQGETLREFVNANKFPIYYYIKIIENKINMNIHFIIKNRKDKERNETTFFEINGYILNESDFNNKRSINGEFIDLKNPISGSYDICFRNGILNINRTIDKGNYVLIKIDSSSHLIEDEIIIEILTMSKIDGNYILPINYYLTDKYDSTEVKRYKIIIDEEEKYREILVEFIPDCSRVTLGNESNSFNMENITDNNGIAQKYRISGFSDDFILKLKVPKDISYGNHIIRYYFTEKQKEFKYELNKKFTKRKVNDVDIIFEFNKLEIINNYNYTTEEKIIFKIYGFLYSDEIDIKNEFFNSSKETPGKISKSQIFIQKDTNFSLYFSNVKSIISNNYKFYLQMKIIVYVGENLFNEHFLIYTLPVNLEKELDKKLTIIIISLILLVLLVIIIIIFTIGLVQLKKKNSNLKKEVLSITFSSEKIDENEDILEKANTRKSENIFI